MPSNTLLYLAVIGHTKLGLSYLHPISSKTPAPKYKHIESKRRKGKHRRQKATEQHMPIKSIGHALETREFQAIAGSARDSSSETLHEMGRNVLRYCEVLQRGGA